MSENASTNASTNGLRAACANFPLPILGVVLFFESLVLMRFVGDVAGDTRALSVALMVGALAVAPPYGSVVAWVWGRWWSNLSRRFGWLSEPPVARR